MVGPPDPQRAALFPPNSPVAEAGYLNNIDCFDGSFFNINGLEARVLDPQQRLLLETAWETLEDGGLRPSKLAGSDVGVYIGAHTHDYLELCARANIEVNAYWNSGLNASILANRISHFFDFTGPSITLNTACSSGLEAIHQAVTAIEAGLCNMALAGGVNLILTPTVTQSAGRAGMLSPKSRCKTFDAAADGFVRGEGVALLALKPLDAAQADGNLIHAVIKGSNSCHGGRANSLTAPNLSRQRDLLVQTYERAKIDPATITYLETHGTGTRLGDSIEIEALKEAFPGEKGLPCGLGAVKTNLGHLESAAGIAGVIKVCLAMKQQTLPATVHYQRPGSLIDLQGTRFFVVRETMPWKPESDPLRAGVSAFGFGGSYAHVILEEPPQTTISHQPTSGPLLIPLSAMNPDRLKTLCANLKIWLERENPELTPLAASLQKGRDVMSCRVAFIVDNLPKLLELLEQFTQNPGEGQNWHFGRKRARGHYPSPVPTDPAATYPFQAKDLYTLAQLWTDGMSIDFTDLMQGAYTQLSLPAYPFAPKRHWI